jgi:pimeloyl-ACP methyl ester carboxylesterase
MLPSSYPFRSEKAQKQYWEFYDFRANHWPIPSITRLVDTSFGYTFVRISGKNNGRPIVLLPGYTANSLMWIPNIKSLSQYFKTYAVDNINDVGRSVPKCKIKTPNEYVTWLDELFTALELKEPINLMGISYGGWLSIQYALNHSNRILKIVLLAPAGVLPLRAEFIFRGLLGLFHPKLFRRFFYWVLKDGVNHENEKTRKVIIETIEDMLLAMQCYRPRTEMPPRKINEAELMNIQVPMLFLVGEHEKIYSPQKAICRIRKYVPNIKAEIITGAGHDINYSQAEIVNKKIVEYLLARE